MEYDKKFPNGFTSWLETHFEVVSYITLEYERDENNTSKVTAITEEKGMGGLYELSEKLTDEFEIIHKDREWKGDFFEEFEYFINRKLNEKK